MHKNSLLLVHWHRKMVWARGATTVTHAYKYTNGGGGGGGGGGGTVAGTISKSALTTKDFTHPIPQNWCPLWY